jgi:hypothetical protein
MAREEGWRISDSGFFFLLPCISFFEAWEEQ